MDAPVTLVASRGSATLESVRAGRPIVVDFWNTRCTKCPAALAKMDAMAAKFPSVAMVACALSLGSSTQGTIEDVDELVGTFPNLEHVYMDFDAKERLKTALEFASLPFAVAYDADARLVFRGDPTIAESASFLHEFARKSASTATTLAAATTPCGESLEHTDESRRLGP